MNKQWIILMLALGLAVRVEAAKGVAEIKGTGDASTLKGTARLEDSPEGLKITAQLIGVPPGAHGFHIHEFGDCSEMGKAAGGHYNPLHSPHGDVLKSGVHKAHVGDMGNVTASANGEVTLNATLHDISLGDGKYTVGGRAIILHEKVDDFSQPTGNAGGRIGCGTIVITGN